MGKTNKKDKKPKESDEVDVKPKLAEIAAEGKIKKKKAKKNKQKADAIKVEAANASVTSESIQKKKKKDKAKKGSSKEVIKKENVKAEKIKTENGTPEASTTGPVTKEEKEDKKVHHDSKPENTIFVGNLPNNTKVKQLNVLFAPFGQVVSVRLRTGQGKKLFKHSIRKKAESLNAYVVFDNVESKEKALKLTGTEYKGRHIRVTAAKDYENEAEPKQIVFVGNLKYSATDEKLYEIFSTCGELDYVRTVRNEKGCSGVAYVCFKKAESVQLALDLNNTILDERPIRVQRYKKNEEKVQGQQKVNSGPVRRMLEKKKKIDKSAGKKIKLEKKNTKSDDTKPVTPKKEKKSDFHGKKTSADKKKIQKNKAKKKGPSHLQKLAKKIAPK